MNRHASLSLDPSDCVGGAWVPISGSTLVSCNPADPKRVIWSGSPRVEHVERAVAAARAAALPWAQLGFDARVKVLRTFQKLALDRVEALTTLIRDEVGKPTWDAKAEAQLIAGKVDITLEEGPHAAMNRVKGFELSLGATKSGRCWFRPHGVMAVIGPFNFPAHLPNGHIVPALAMGNTIVFKPSDKAPAVGQFIGELFAEAMEACNAPRGVFNLVQGGAEVASALCSHDDIDGVLFTGSWDVGRRIMAANLDRPGRVLALEMGGNNAALILDDADIEQAVTECVRCAFITAGQRCTCTRRVIVQRGVADQVIEQICRATSSFIIGDPAAEDPVFMGPVISQQARSSIMASYSSMARAADAKVLVAMQETGSTGWYLSPGVLLVDRFVVGAPSGLAGDDVEVFGPLLRISIVDSLEEGIAQCNATRFGLAASLFSKNEHALKQFASCVRAGCINWNTGTAGASSKLPFGGLGHSGNHRPAGAFSLDYCACPIAGMLERSNASLKSPGMQ
ncbi:MAG: aldehyde dehydrogenase family protein [Planctomycetota bacterium]|nr:aldehyde dehydrogenase family protein [Planctomycetota bacterium]